MSESEWTKILGWPEYRVYRSEINEESKKLRLWVRRKRGNRKLECSGCGRRIKGIAEIYEREVRFRKPRRMHSYSDSRSEPLFLLAIAYLLL